MATLIAPKHTSAVEDAEKLQKACKGNLNLSISAIHSCFCFSFLQSSLLKV